MILITHDHRKVNDALTRKMMRPYPHRDEIYMMNSQSTMQIVWVTGIEIPTLARSHHYQLRVPGNM